MEKRVAVLQTHPTQFDGHVFERISNESGISLKVFYTSKIKTKVEKDSEINKNIRWPNRKLNKYEFEVLNKSLKGIKKFTEEIREFDLVIASGYNEVVNILATAVSKVNGNKAGLRIDDTFLYRKKENNIKWILKDLVIPLILSVYDFVFPVSNLSREYVIEYGVPKEKALKYPYSVDINYLKNAAKRKKERNDIKNNYSALYVSKLVDREDPMTLIKAYNKIKNNYENISLMMVGEGPKRRQIENYIERENIESANLEGYVDYEKLPSYYEKADVYIHTAKREPWGCSVQEAMALGTPVVASDTVGAAHDMINNGENGFVYKSGSPKDLADSVDEFLSMDSRKKKKMSIKAEKTANEWNHEVAVNSIKRSISVD